MGNKIFNPQTLREDYGAVRFYESEEVPEGAVWVGETHEMVRFIMEKHPQTNCHCVICVPHNEIEVVKSGAYTVKHLAANNLFLDHALAINDILVRVDVLCRGAPEKFRLITLQHDRDLKVANLGLPIVPDGFFEIALLETKEAYPVLLELDLDTEERFKWTAKIEGYLNIMGKPAEKAFGFRHPTILTVAATKKRMLELKKWTEQVMDKRDWDDIEKLFYFT